MRYYPINLDIRGRCCLVIGGGRVAARKVKTLLSCGARVTVVCLTAAAELKELAAEKQIRLLQRSYRPTDAQDAFLVIGATDDPALNQRIHQDAEQVGRLCNIADQPQLCNFILPAVIRQGDLTIAISTNGKSPAFAKYLRKQLQDQFGTEYADLLILMGAIRSRLLEKEHAPEAHKPLFEQLIAGGLLQAVRRADSQEINRLLAAVLGPGFDYDQLMKEP